MRWIAISRRTANRIRIVVAPYKEYVPSDALVLAILPGDGRAHLQGRDDALVEVGPALERAPRFTDLLDLSLDEQAALDGLETLSPQRVEEVGVVHRERGEPPLEKMARRGR